MLTTPQVAELIGASFRQLDYWARKGACLPLENEQGSGSRRLWPPAEIRVARVLLAYADLIQGAPTVRLDLAEAVRSAGPADAWIIVGSDSAYATDAGHIAGYIEALAGSAVVLTIPTHVATPALELR